MPPIEYMSLKEGREKGYTPVHRLTQADIEAQEPDLVDMAFIIGPEVIGSIAGGWLGFVSPIPGGTYIGSSIGGGLGNLISQFYRVNQGMQEDYGLGELGVATAVSALPFDKLGVGKSFLGKVATRGAQGVAIAEADLFARTYFDQKRGAPSWEEMKKTALFGGVLGGVMGAVEAKLFNDLTGVGGLADKSREEVVKAVGEEIERNPGGILRSAIMEGVADGRPLLLENKLAKDLFRLPVRDRRGAILEGGDIPEWVRHPTDSSEVVVKLNPRQLAERIVGQTEDVVFSDVANYVQRLARRPDDASTPREREYKRLLEGITEPHKEALRHGISPESIPQTPAQARAVMGEVGALHREASEAMVEGMDPALLRQPRSEAEGLAALSAQERRDFTLPGRPPVTREAAPVTESPVSTELMSPGDRHALTTFEATKMPGGDVPALASRTQRKLEELTSERNAAVRKAHGHGATSFEIEGIHGRFAAEINRLEKDLDVLRSPQAVLEELSPGLLGRLEAPKTAATQWADMGEVAEMLLREAGTMARFTPGGRLTLAQVHQANVAHAANIKDNPRVVALASFLSDPGKFGVRMKDVDEALTGELIGKLRNGWEKKLDEYLTDVRRAASIPLEGILKIPPAMRKGILRAASAEELDAIASGVSGGMFTQSKHLRNVLNEIQEGESAFRRSPINQPQALEAARARKELLDDLGIPKGLQGMLMTGKTRPAELLVNAADEAVAKHLTKVGFDPSEALLLTKGRNLPAWATTAAGEKLPVVKTKQSIRGIERNFDLYEFTKALLPKGVQNLQGVSKAVNDWLKLSKDAPPRELKARAAQWDKIKDAHELMRSLGAEAAAAYPYRSKGKLSLYPQLGLNVALGATALGGAASEMTAEERDRASRAGVGTALFVLFGLAFAGGAGRAAIKAMLRRTPKSLMRALKNPDDRSWMLRRQPRGENPGNTGFESALKAGNDPKAKWTDSVKRDYMDSIYDFAKSLGEPLSRTLQSVARTIDPESGKVIINKGVATIFREAEMQIQKRTTAYRQAVMPILNSFYKKTNKKYHQEIEDNLLHTTERGYGPLLRTLEQANKKVEWDKDIAIIRKTLEDVRHFARSVGGIDVGDLPNFFPRLFKNYDEFHKELIDRGIRTGDLDKALTDEARRHGYKTSEQLPPDIRGQVVNDYLQGGVHLKAGEMPNAAKQRVIGDISGILAQRDKKGRLKYYDTSPNAMEVYIQRMVEKSIFRQFQGKKPLVNVARDRVEDANYRKERYASRIRDFTDGKNATISGSGNKYEITFDTIGGERQKILMRPKGKPVTPEEARVIAANKLAGLDTDAHRAMRRDKRNRELGADREPGSSIGDKLAEFIKRHGMTHEQSEIIRDVMNARMSYHGSPGRFLSKAKQFNYAMLLTNLGATVTQLSDQFFSIVRYGLSETAQAWVRKEYDFAKHWGISTFDLDNMSTTGGTLGKLLQTAFQRTGFNKLDKFATNTAIHAGYSKFKKQARAGGRAEAKLRKALEEHGGALPVDKVVNDLKANRFTDDVELFLFTEIMDVKPANPLEMSKAYSENPKFRIAYQFKNWTMKQVDFFRGQAENKLLSGASMMKRGNMKGGANEFAEGIADLVGLSLIFIASTGVSDITKDIMYGRPIDVPDMMEDNIYRLMGLTKYFARQVDREEPLEAIRDYLLPPFTFLDGIAKDVDALLEGEGWRGKSTRGLPFGDFYYWWFGDGRERIKREAEKRSD